VRRAVIAGKTTWVAVGLLSLATALVAAAHARSPLLRAPAAGGVAWRPCPGDVDPSVRCATLEVPLRRTPRAGGRLRLSLTRLAGPHADLRRVAFLLDGGPGYATSTPESFLDGDLGRGLAAREAVVLVDQRGTGRSGAIDCPGLQHTTAVPVAPALLDARVRSCARHVGSRADAYSSKAAAEDLEAVRRAIGAARVDLYGVSYGTLLARTFVLRHPKVVRTVVLDGSFPIDLPPLLDDIRRAGTGLLQRTCGWVACPDDPVDDLAAVVRSARSTPLRATLAVSSGRPEPVTVGPTQIAALLQAAGSSPALTAELAAALHAARGGDQLPLARSWATFRANTDDPPAGSYSAGLSAATSCADYPLPFDPRGDLRARHRQLEAAEARLSGVALGPFTGDEWVRALGTAGPAVCLAWPAAGHPGPPFAARAAWPRVPTLVLQGDLDTVTSAEQARRVVRGLPGAQLVTFAAGPHDLLEHDAACVTPLVAAFIATGGARVHVPPCASTGRPAIDPVARFARRAEGLAEPSRRPGDASTPEDREHAAAVLLAVADAMRHAGPGLRGGRTEVHGRCRTLTQVRVVEDVAVDGRVCVVAGRLDARVETSRLRLRARGRLHHFRLRRPTALTGSDRSGRRITLVGDLG